MKVYLVRNNITGSTCVCKTANPKFNMANWWKYTKNNLLKKAVRKYGLCSFSVKPIANNIKCREEMDELFTQEIIKRNSHINGYNDLSECISPCMYYLISPDGSLRRTSSLLSFCQDQKLCYSRVYEMTKGMVKSYKNWGFCTKKDINLSQYIINLQLQPLLHQEFTEKAM